MTREDIKNVIYNNIRNIVEGAKDADIQETNTMRDFGADSLQSVEVVSRSMKELRIKVPRTELSTATNLKELVDLFERSAAAPAAPKPGA